MKRSKLEKLKLLDFKGLIVQQALTFYRMIPKQWAHRIDVADFIADGFCYMAEHLHIWDEYPEPKPGAATTFVFLKTQSYYLHYLEGLRTQKRSATMVSMEDTVGMPDGYLGKENLRIKDILDEAVLFGERKLSEFVAARMAVERLHRAASRPLLSMLEDAFFSENQKIMKSTNPRFKICKKEFVKLAKANGVTIDAYRLVIGDHAAQKEAVRIAEEKHELQRY